MKNTSMKTFIVACIATLAFIGPKTSTAEAITEYQVVKGDSLWKLGQQHDVAINDIKQSNERHDDMIYIGEILQIPDKTEEAAVQVSEPKKETPEKKQEKPSKPKKETPKKEKEKPAISMSNKEKDLLSRLVQAEAKGESYEGKVAVATVVLNRVDSPEFPNTVTGVINEVVGDAYAFTPVQNGEINKPASAEAKKAVEEALTRKDRLNNAIYFYNPDIATDEWIRSRDVIKTIDNHVFAK